jgi:hypothetical protein
MTNQKKNLTRGGAEVFQICFAVAKNRGTWHHTPTLPNSFGAVSSNN